MAKLNWKSQKEIDKEEKERQKEQKKREKHKGKGFHQLNTPEKWGLLEILARDAGLID